MDSDENENTPPACRRGVFCGAPDWKFELLKRGLAWRRTGKEPEIVRDFLIM